MAHRYELKTASWRSGRPHVPRSHDTWALRANSSLLVFQRAGQALDEDGNWAGSAGTWLTFSCSREVFHWLQEQRLFRRPCVHTVTHKLSPCGSKVGCEVEELSIKCSHSNFLQRKEEGIQDCYHWPLDVGWSRIALSQLTLSLCSYAIRLQFPLLLTSSALKIFYSSSRLSPQPALGSLPACSHPSSDGSTLFPQSASALLPLFCQKQHLNATIHEFLNLTWAGQLQLCYF